jgi:hypothetical protein
MGSDRFSTKESSQRSDSKLANPWDPNDHFSDFYFEECVQALEDLNREGYFGTGSVRENTFVTFSFDEMLNEDDWVQRLNPSSVYKRYCERQDSY